MTHKDDTGFTSIVTSGEQAPGGRRTRLHAQVRPGPCPGGPCLPGWALCRGARADASSPHAQALRSALVAGVARIGVHRLSTEAAPSRRDGPQGEAGHLHLEPTEAQVSTLRTPGDLDASLQFRGAAGGGARGPTSMTSPPTSLTSAPKHPTPPACRLRREPLARHRRLALATAGPEPKRPPPAPGAVGRRSRRAAPPTDGRAGSCSPWATPWAGPTAAGPSVSRGGRRRWCTSCPRPSSSRRSARHSTSSTRTH